ncbi:MAG: hypothetical protein KBA43_05655 [Paludibacteraceae bacterium]|nr:hypothetical protein [Paludibacteraceae bacterium]
MSPEVKQANLQTAQNQSKKKFAKELALSTQEKQNFADTQSLPRYSLNILEHTGPVFWPIVGQHY